MEPASTNIQPAQVTIDCWLRPMPAEEMPMLAARMLAENHDTPALRLTAGLAADDGPRIIRCAFQQALAEMRATRGYPTTWRSSC